MKKKSETFLLIENELFECEIGQSDLYGRYNNTWQEINILDVIGLAEEKATVYGSLKVNVKDIDKEVSFKLANRWAYVYKDEMIEVLEDLGTEILKSFYDD